MLSASKDKSIPHESHWALWFLKFTSNVLLENFLAQVGDSHISILQPLLFQVLRRIRYVSYIPHMNVILLIIWWHEYLRCRLNHEKLMVFNHLWPTKGIFIMIQTKTKPCEQNKFPASVWISHEWRGSIAKQMNIWYIRWCYIPQRRT